MSKLQFPKDPIVGQQYDFPPYKYYWDGTKWKTMGIGYNPVNDLRDQLAAVGSQVIIGGVKADTIASNINNGFFKNKIVDGRFDFWYEGTDQTLSGYGSDTMWANTNSGSTKTHQRLELAPGVDLPCIENPSALYASRTIVSSVTGAGNYVRKVHKIESARTLGGKKATLSFYAKADSSKFLGISLKQMFGTGGSPSETVTVLSTKLQITSNWVRYSMQIDIPSTSGKYLGINKDDCLVLTFGFDQGTDFSAEMGNLGHQSGTFYIACVQLEEGEQATKFEELPIEISQLRVYRYFNPKTTYMVPLGGTSTSTMAGSWTLSTPMRAKGNITYWDAVGNINKVTTSSNGNNISFLMMGSISVTGPTTYSTLLCDGGLATSGSGKAWFSAQIDARL